MTIDDKLTIVRNIVYESIYNISSFIHYANWNLYCTKCNNRRCGCL